jgi:hypothetical protein
MYLGEDRETQNVYREIPGWPHAQAEVTGEARGHTGTECWDDHLLRPGTRWADP